MTGLQFYSSLTTAFFSGCLVGIVLIIAIGLIMAKSETIKGLMR